MKQMILALLAVGVAWGADAAVVYRGRLVDMRDPQQNLNLGPTKTMTFRFYDDNGTERQELGLRQEVPLEADGSFTAHLDSQGLTEAIQQGTVTQVGLTIGRAAKEVQPRRKLLPTARATQAVTASGLSRGATVNSLTAETLEADQVSVVGNLTVGGAIKPENATRFERKIGYTAKMSDNGGRLALKGTTKVFGAVVKLVEDKFKAGAQLCQAPADGVAVITCKDPIIVPGNQSFSVFGESPNFSVVQFCHNGEAIKVPAGWNWAPPREDPAGNIPSCYSSDNNSDRTFGVYFYKFLD